jgi:hypothetical protein
MSKTVIGLLDNLGEAQNVVKDLVARHCSPPPLRWRRSARQRRCISDSA